MTKKQSSTALHWRRRQSRSNPIPPDQAVRQGDITNLAFLVLGRDRAIAFLNTENRLLGGRPIALATESRAGQLHVEAELSRMRERQIDQISLPH
jgi:hypothetical protein